MQKILVLGAGMVAGPLIRYLQEHAGEARVLPVGKRLLVGNTLLRYGLRDVRGPHADGQCAGVGEDLFI